MTRCVLGARLLGALAHSSWLQFRDNPATTLDLQELSMAVAIDPNSKHHSFHLVFDGGSKRGLLG